MHSLLCYSLICRVYPDCLCLSFSRSLNASFNVDAQQQQCQQPPFVSRYFSTPESCYSEVQPEPVPPNLGTTPSTVESAATDAQYDPLSLILVFENQTLSPFSYNMHHTRRGMCVVLCVDKFDAHLNLPERIGSDKDARLIESCFTSLGFQCYFLRNPIMRDMRMAMHQTAAQDHRDADCFACVILTHGEQGGIIYARDGPLKLDDIISPFKGDVCPTLAGKPKMFFIQACRGSELDHGVMVTDGGQDESDGGGQTLTRIPTEADFLLAFSVTSGYFSWRNSSRGSWFIQSLAAMLEKYASSLDLLTILTRVSHMVAYEFESKAATKAWSGKKQIPCIVSMLTKDVYFCAEQQTSKK